MPIAFVDTSCLSRVVLKEPGHERMTALLEEFGVWKASPLLYAELRSVCKRERVASDCLEFLERVEWVEAPGPLLPEIDQALEAGYLRGADLWHVASALYARFEEPDLTFLTLDLPQARVARALKFRVLPEGAGTLGVRERRSRYAAMPVRGRRVARQVGAAATRGRNEARSGAAQSSRGRTPRARG